MIKSACLVSLLSIIFLQVFSVFGQSIDNWERFSKYDRISAIKKMTDQSLLANIAKNDNSEEVRAAAVKKLKDQSILSEIVKNDISARVRRTAAELITDKKLLVSLSLSDPDYIVRGIGVYGNYSDSVIFKRIKVKSDFDAVKAIQSQTLLIEIAKNHSDYNMREQAAKKITDQTTLEELTKNDPKISVREAAITNLDNQVLLVEIVLNEPDNDLREAAVEKLTDQAILKKIIKTDKVGNVRVAATRGLDGTDQIFLTEIAKNDPNMGVRRAAVTRINDKAVLKEIAKNDSHHEVRSMALKGIKDNDILMEMLKDTTISEHHKYIAQELNEITKIAFIAENHPDSYVRSKMKHKAVVYINGTLFDEKGQPKIGETVYLIPIKDGGTVLKYKKGKVNNPNGKSENYGRFTVEVDLDMLQKYEEFSIGLVKEISKGVMKKNIVNRLKTPDGAFIQLKFEGNFIQEVELGQITVE